MIAFMALGGAVIGIFMYSLTHEHDTAYHKDGKEMHQPPKIPPQGVGKAGLV